MTRYSTLIDPKISSKELEMMSKFSNGTEFHKSIVFFNTSMMYIQRKKS